MGKRAYSCVFCFCIGISGIVGADDKDQSKEKKQESSVNGNNQQTFVKNVNNVNVTTLVNNQVINYLISTMTQAMQQVREQLQNMSNSLILAVQTFVWEQKWYLLFGSLVGSYGGLNAYLYYIDRELHDPCRWFYWKKQYELPDLYLLNQDALSRELITEIQQRYTTATNPADFITPLIHFMTDIARECLLLSRYITFGHMLDKIRFKQYTVYNAELASSAEEWLRRSTFFRALFMHWVANFKLDQQTIAHAEAPVIKRSSRSRRRHSCWSY